ncbi:hypothetical protein SAMN05216419_10301 [Nitrosomonas cryotolerans]|uniref:Flavoprotein, HI0933 family n=1 Tax=Nitrosomonas cryotolerans ATCC 49181 TaxID=1131553 RepID=A0A1N6IJ53_9PROT|nr:NAD(P)/FAD-dependent oxidoreductase [Nitrosomonas cryotolerans]SFP89659.1 hypothetical protein SAMN05216419_10301 [Nitrosomonas cryotolerans]SIO32009.1 hypothetical protein SAMN02743940_1850 [Nitrosomonas cryotolerans ATCC 49181]
MKLIKDVVIIGAGAAGMMCAIEAGKRGRSVLLLDHATKLAEKIRISGGGRCNFTNLYTHPENFLSDNPHFCRSALARFKPQDFVSLLKKHDILYHEKKLGQLFCNDSSQQIINLLQKECNAVNVAWQLSSRVERIDRVNISGEGDSHDQQFILRTDRNTITAKSLVIATGGLSIPQIGASAFGYRVAEQFNISVTSLHPALVALTFRPEDLTHYAEMSGISIDAVISCNGASFHENILFTHRGLSGPAILQISSYWSPGDAIHINLLPQYAITDILSEYKHSAILLTNLLARYLPKRFVDTWSQVMLQTELNPMKPMKQYSDNELNGIVEHLQNWKITPSGTVGYRKAEVTRGGINTRELSSKTMETSKVPGLYFIGEVIDVTGHLGGFNFQWAWSSGYAAGQYV